MVINLKQRDFGPFCSIIASSHKTKVNHSTIKETKCKNFI
ncbi:hypothetical protein [Escherichia phage pEC-M719-6WT.2]|nr:hypothetical protein [Escherichia phage pEC-M719-6WT.2]